MRHVALLRGVNVGTGARVPMKTLKACFEELGFSGVVTYLNSGNVVFESSLDVPESTQLIADKLELAAD